MNGPIRRVSVVIMLMFLALMVNASYAYVFRTQSLNNDPANRRVRDAEFGTDPHLGPFEQVFGACPNGTSVRTQGEYSFGADQVELALDAANQPIDSRLAHSRWRCFSREWIRDHKGDSLDISWLKDKDSVDAADLPEPLELANEAKAELEAALAELQVLVQALEGIK